MDQPPGQPISYNPYGQEEGLLKFQIDNEEVIEMIRHSILEETPYMDNNTGNVFWKNATGRPPMVNEIGMASMETKMRSRMTKVFSLSDFSEDTIKRFSESFADEVIDDLENNWDLYKVRSPSSASAIVSLMVDNFYSILRKSKNALYLKFLKTSQIVQERNDFTQRMEQNPQTNGFEEARRSLPLMFGGFMKKR